MAQKHPNVATVAIRKFDVRNDHAEGCCDKRERRRAVGARVLMIECIELPFGDDRAEIVIFDHDPGLLP